MDTSQIELLIQRAFVLRNTQARQAIGLLDEAMILAQQSGQKAFIAKIIFDKAHCQFIRKQYKLSLSAFTEALQYYTELGNVEMQMACYMDISSVYVQLSDIPSSLQQILKRLSLHSGNGDSVGVASDYNEIGKLYSIMQDYPNAIDYFRRALKIFENLQLKKEMVHSYYLIGSAYSSKEDFDKALYYLLRASNSVQLLNDLDIQANTLGSLALAYTRTGEYEQALSFFNDAIRLAMNGASPAVRAELKWSLGNLYIELTQYDKAIEVLGNALQIARLTTPKAQLAKIHSSLSLAYEKISDYKMALDQFQKYTELEKEAISEEVQLKTKALHIRFDLEELKKQKEIAELSDKLKEQFLANVSHEIRTPMNGVLGMTHLLSRTNPNKEQQEYIDAIRLSANNLMSIINDILDFSKINAGKIEFSETEFSLRELIRSTMQIFQVRAEEKKIKIGCTIDYQVKDNLSGDPIRLNQILNNLLGNAVKFTEKGTVSLDVKLLESGEDTVKLKFTVKDSGIGIPENKLQTIFESFEQAGDSKKRYEGTGLGLTIVKQLVENQGGRIRVLSRMNEGSEFIFELTFKAGKQKQVVAEVQPRVSDKSNADFSQVRVLIVEDNKVNQLLVKNMLRNFGFEHFDTAENGKVALHKLSDTDYDLILMDIQMPEMDGYEITREIRKRLRPEMRNVPVIAVSADASEKEKTKAREAGMNDYVVKPYTPEELYDVLIRFIPSASAKKPVTVKKKRTLEVRAETIDLPDLRHLDKYTGGDREITIQLIEIFLRQVPEAIDKLAYHIPRNDWKEVHAIAHKVKSSIAIFELTEMKNLIMKIENHARDLEFTETIPGDFESFVKGAQPVLNFLVAELKKRKEEHV